MTVLRSPHTPGTVLQLNSGWSKVFGTAARPIFDLAYLDELQTALSTLTNCYFERFVNIRRQSIDAMSEFDEYELQISRMQPDELANESEMVKRMTDFAKDHHIPFRGLVAHASGDWGVYVIRDRNSIYPVLIKPSIQIPSLDYRRKFDSDLQAAVTLADEDRKTMSLALEGRGARKHWRILCEMFIQNGKVVRTSRPIVGTDFKRWNMTRPNFDRAVCKFRENKTWNPWRPSAKGVHLIKNEDMVYSLAW